MPFAPIEGKRLHYSEFRDTLVRSRLPLVLVHGAGGNIYHWPPAVRRMAGNEVYAIDLPGHGRSDGPGCKDIESYAESVFAWANYLELPPFVLAGHSMGGAIAATFALKYLQQLKGLIVISSSAKLPVNPRILQGMQADPEGVGRLLVDWVHGHRASSSQRRQYLRQFLAVQPEVMIGDWIACDSYDISDQIGQIDAPTLILVGSQDRMTPPKYCQLLGDGIPDADMTIIEGAGHMLMLEQPILVASAMAGFLARLRHAN